MGCPLIRALTVRHLAEQAYTDILRRLARAYEPYPLVPMRRLPIAIKSSISTCAKLMRNAIWKPWVEHYRRRIVALDGWSTTQQTQPGIL